MNSAQKVKRIEDKLRYKDGVFLVKRSKHWELFRFTSNSQYTPEEKTLCSGTLDEIAAYIGLDFSPKPTKALSKMTLGEIQKICETYSTYRALECQELGVCPLAKNGLCRRFFGGEAPEDWEKNDLKIRVEEV